MAKFVVPTSRIVGQLLELREGHQAGWSSRHRRGPGSIMLLLHRFQRVAWMEARSCLSEDLVHGDRRAGGEEERDVLAGFINDELAVGCGHFCLAALCIQHPELARAVFETSLFLVQYLRRGVRRGK